MLIKNNDLLRQERMSVSDEGEIVVFRIGNSELKMHYNTALQLSAWFRLHGRKAKRFAGDTSRNLTVIGSLSDLNGSA